MTQPTTEPKLYTRQAAERAGVQPSTWRAYCSPRDGRPPRGPKPDGTDVRDGHAMPYWYPSTVDAWLAGRPGQGKGGGRPRTYHSETLGRSVTVPED